MVPSDFLAERIQSRYAVRGSNHPGETAISVFMPDGTALSAGLAGLVTRTTNLAVGGAGVRCRAPEQRPALAPLAAACQRPCEDLDGPTAEGAIDQR